MWAYLLGAIGSALMIVLILPIRVAPTPRASEPVTLRSLLAGISFVRRTELILATIMLDLFAMLLGGASGAAADLRRGHLASRPGRAGLAPPAPAIGAFLMAMRLAHRPLIRNAGPALLWAMAGFGVATIVFGLSRDSRLSFAMLLLIGAMDNISSVVRATLFQLLTPDAMRGRVSAVNSIFIGSANELGGFESGLTAQLFGPVVSVVAGGIGTILVVLTVAQDLAARPSARIAPPGGTTRGRGHGRVVR